MKKLMSKLLFVSVMAVGLLGSATLAHADTTTETHKLIGSHNIKVSIEVDDATKAVIEVDIVWEQLAGLSGYNRVEEDTGGTIRTLQDVTSFGHTEVQASSDLVTGVVSWTVIVNQKEVATGSDSNLLSDYRAATDKTAQATVVDNFIAGLRLGDSAMVFSALNALLDNTLLCERLNAQLPPPR